MFWNLDVQVVIMKYAHKMYLVKEQLHTSYTFSINKQLVYASK